MSQRISESANQRINESASQQGGKSAFILFIIILLFALFFAALAVQQHNAYLTNGLDIGNVDQALWNTAHGRLMQFSLMTPVQNRLALHVEPILLVFVPFYWLGLSGPKLLLIVQAGVVALGAWPLYQLAANRFQIDGVARPLVRWVALILPLAYLLLPTLESAALYDFHAVTLAPTFLLAAFWALERRRTGWLWLFAALAMATKEDMPLVVAMLGLYAGLAQRRWRLAAAIIAVAALWFGAAVLLIQPLFAAGGNIQLDRYAWLGDSPGAMLATLLTRPGLVLAHLRQVNAAGYLLHLFFPTAFLALLSPLTLVPLLPSLAVNLLSDNPFTWRLEDFHYGAPLAPFLFISTIHSISWLNRKVAAFRFAPFLVALLLLVLAFSGVYHYQRGYTPLSRAFVWPTVTGHHRQVDALLATIPPDAPVFAQSNLAPHVSQRQFIFTDFAYFTNPAFPAAAPAQHILLDVTAFENRGGLHQFLRQTLLDSGRYQLVAAADGLLHFISASGSRPVALPPSFFTFTQPAPPPQFPLAVNFGDAVRLRGYSLHFNRQEEVQVTVDLEPLRPLVAIQPVLYLLDAAGQPVGATTDPQPALVWYPVEQWPVGQVVRVRFNTLPWYTRDIAAYRLALGVVDGADPWALPARQRPQLAGPTPFAVRLPAEGTLVELARIEQPWQMPGGGPLPRRFSRPAPPQSLSANFAGQFELFGADSPHITPLPDGSELLSVTLYWQALAAPENLVRFAQLVGPDGQLYGQQDSPPDNGQYPTPLWQPGEVVVETVTFPVAANRPPGNATLHVGLYRPTSGERLSLAAGGDHVELGVPSP